jgi:putative cardiolipin synthase
MMSLADLTSGVITENNSIWLTWVCVLAALLLAGCASLPQHPAAPSSAPAQVSGATQLSRALAPVIAEHPGLSGVYPLEHGTDAFAARMVLAAAAERTLDVQYYIWHPDDAGKLLANQLIQAADRGVHVRLLLDDIGTNPMDARVLALDSHKNIEVRLFNPAVNRTFRKLNFLFEFGRLNRRMHNKSFTADRQVTIIGGRNIGDEYFGIGPGVEFADMDVMAVGPVVDAATTSFDLYWNSPSSVPIALLNRKKVSPEWTSQQRAALATHCEAMQDSAYLRATRDSRLINELRGGKLPLFWGRAWLAYDLPNKVTTAPEDRATHLIPQLRPVIDATDREVLIVSPYFVPGKTGLAFFQALRKRGVRVVVVTNSLGATDVTAVHSGYRRYRKALLRAGVELYEFKATASLKEVSPTGKSAGGSGPGSSGASLHAKIFVFDQRIIFVGSLNLDPRSAALNTEIGAVLEVPDLATREAAGIEQNALRNAYRLELVPGPGPCKECSRINWVSEENGTTTRYTREPGASFGRRCLVNLLSLLPLESQL